MESNAQGGLWRTFRASPDANAKDALISAVSEGVPSQEHLAAVQVLRISATDIAWDELGEAAFNRLQNVTTVEPGQERPLHRVHVAIGSLRRAD